MLVLLIMINFWHNFKNAMVEHRKTTCAQISIAFGVHVLKWCPPCGMSETKWVLLSQLEYDMGTGYAR